MQWIDVVIIAIVALSALVSVARGFIKEMLSLIAWVAAFFVATNFHAQLATLFTFTDDSAVRTVLALISLFVSTLIIIGIINMIITMLLKKTGLSGTDRILGMIFGAGRGLLIVIVAASILQLLFNFGIFTVVQKEDWYTQSIILPELMKAASQLISYFGLK